MAGSMGSFTFDGGGINQMLDRRQNQSQFLRKLLSDEMALAAQSRNAEKALQLQRELGLGGLQLDRDRFGLEGELARGSMGLNRDRFGFEQEQGRAATGLAGRRLDLESMSMQRQDERERERLRLEALGITNKAEQDKLLDERERIQLAQQAQRNQDLNTQFGQEFGFKQESLKAQMESAEKDRQNRLEAERVAGEEKRKNVGTEKDAAIELEKAKGNVQDFLAGEQFKRAQKAAETNPEIAKIANGIIESLSRIGDPAATTAAVNFSKSILERLGFSDKPNVFRDVASQPQNMQAVGGEPAVAPPPAQPVSQRRTPGGIGRPEPSPMPTPPPQAIQEYEALRSAAEYWRNSPAASTVRGMQGRQAAIAGMQRLEAQYPSLAGG